MVGIILSDGEVSPDEIEAFRLRIINLVEVEKAKELVACLKNLKSPNLEKIALPKAEAFEVLKTLTQIAGSDGALARNEERTLHRMSRLLGLPESVTDLVLERVEKGLTASLNVRVVAKKVNQRAIGLAWTQTYCALLTEFSLESEERLQLEVVEPSKEEGKGLVSYSPISAVVDRIKASQEAPGKYIIHVRFQTALRVSHGVLHHIFPHRYENGKPEVVKTPFLKEITAAKGHCKVCGDREVLFWPHDHEVLSYNLFGLPSLLPDKLTSNGLPFQAYMASLCPKCMFASEDGDFVYVVGNEVNPFPLPPRFRNNWMASIPQRRIAKNLSSQERWEVTNRDLEQGITCWKAVLETNHTLASQEWPWANHYKVKKGKGLIQFAETSLLTKQLGLATDYLRDAYQALSESAKELKGMEAALVHAMRVMVSLCLEDPERAGRSAVEFNHSGVGDDQKEIFQKIQTALSYAVENKKSYALKGLSNFAGTEEFPGLSQLGKEMSAAAQQR